MSRIEKSEEEELLRNNPHLQKYLESIQKKMDRPIFYSKLWTDVASRLLWVIYIT